MDSAKHGGLGDVVMASLAAGGIALGTWGMYLAWQVAPVERTLKMSQKIFYFHAPLGIWMIATVLVAAGASAAYLWRRDPRADLLCEACMEVSVVACAAVLVTGSIWARVAWDTWFPWGEPRVTSVLVLLLIGLAYLVLRSSVEEEGRRARFSSVVALVGAADALLAYFAIHIWNTTHPRVITATEVKLDPTMAKAFLVCIGAVGLMLAGVIQARYRLGHLRHLSERAMHEWEEALEGRSA